MPKKMTWPHRVFAANQCRKDGEREEISRAFIHVSRIVTADEHPKSAYLDLRSDTSFCTMKPLPQSVSFLTPCGESGF
jgi:hypothetical protein